MSAIVSEARVNRRYADAALMGLSIGLCAIMLEVWVGESEWPGRIGALLLVGSALCAAQYGLMRWRRRR
jgi:hypothetical protein